MHALPPTMTTSPLPTTSMTSTPSAQQVRHGHRWQQVGSNDNKYAEGDDDSMYAKCVDDDKTLDKDNSNKYAKKCDLAEGNGNDKPLAEGQRKWWVCQGQQQWQIQQQILTNNNQPKTCGCYRGGEGEEVQPRLVLDNAGTTAVVVFVNHNSGIPLSKSPLAPIVYISAGQKGGGTSGQLLARGGATRGGGASSRQHNHWWLVRFLCLVEKTAAAMTKFIGDCHYTNN
jgi:hypothetical protein